MPARRATWPNGEWGYSACRHMLEPVRPEAVLPGRALCLPTFSHFLIVNKTSLSRARARAFSLSPLSLYRCFLSPLFLSLARLLARSPSFLNFVVYGIFFIQSSKNIKMYLSAKQNYVSVFVYYLSCYKCPRCRRESPRVQVFPLR